MGSDLDLVVIVREADARFEERGSTIDTSSLPVPADVLVCTPDEWTQLEGRMREVLREEVVWVAEADEGLPTAGDGRWGLIGRHVRVQQHDSGPPGRERPYKKNGFSNGLSVGRAVDGGTSVDQHI